MINKIKDWLKDKDNLIFLGILLLAILVRLYFFISTLNQPVWYDEADYLSTAKHWASGINYNINPQRPILLPFLESIFFNLGGGESLIRFFLVLLPSIGVVILTYMLGKKLYNKKIALIASFIMSVFWTLLFNTVRIHVEALLMFLLFLSILFFWKGFVEGSNNSKLFFGLFIGLSFLTKFTSVLLIATLLIFLIIIQGFKFLKDRYFWLTILTSFLVLLPYFIWSKIKFGNFLVFIAGSGQVSSVIVGEEIGRPIGWYVFNFIPIFSDTIFFILFFIGLLTLYKLIVGFDLVLGKKHSELNSDLLIILFLIINLLFFVFIQRSAEDRWIMPIALSLFLITAKGVLLIYNQLKKFNKHIAIIAILILLFFGAYEQLDSANELINAKKDTYAQVKDAALWLKENSNPDDVILTASGTQTTYYAERETIPYGDEETTVKKINELNAKYMVVSVFEGHPDWAFSYPQRNNLQPVRAYFADAERTQPLLIIYQFQ